MLRTINKDKRFQSIFPNDQQFQIEETNAHLVSHWSIILVKVRQHTVNPGCQDWWLAVKKCTIAMPRLI